MYDMSTFVGAERLFTPDDLATSVLRDDILPTKTDVLLYMLSGSRNSNKKDVHQTAKKVIKIWEAADCCPLALTPAKRIVEKLKVDYKFFLNNYNDDGTKRSKVKKKKKLEVDNSEPPTKKTRLQCQKVLRTKWDQEHGDLLFDIKSAARTLTSFFDEEFYLDQKDPTKRKLRVMLTKVTAEFFEAEIKRRTKAARSLAYQKSAMGACQDDQQAISFSRSSQSESSDHTQSSQDEGLESVALGLDLTSTPATRTRARSNMPVVEAALCSQGTQTEEFVPVKDVRDGNKIKPCYLESISLLMASGLSTAAAIRAVAIVDRVVWGQIRHLPYELDKDLVNAVNKLRKLEKQTSSLVLLEAEESVQIPMSDVILPAAMDPQDAQANTINETNNEEPEPEVTDTALDRLRVFVAKELATRSNSKEVLPSRRIARYYHSLLAVYIEGQIGQQMAESESYILPDGTSRAQVGEIAAMTVNVGGRTRAVKALQITATDRDNWSAAVINILDRLSTASGNELEVIWKSVQCIISDLCKVNVGLAQTIKEQIGLDWAPGQAYCNLHFTLAVPEAVKTVMKDYQSYIGAAKLFPETVGFEMNLENELLVIQILDCWMRLTSIRWHVRSWNYYQDFTDFAEEKRYSNVGHMLHANRFGEFEERCAGGLYLASVWIEWIQSRPSIRNQLSCYLRTIIGIMDICKFSWCGAALIGLHLTMPFMSMLLDHRATPNQLLEILPALHQDLLNYSTDLTCLDHTACLPSLKPYWLDPLDPKTSPYGVEVCKALKDYLAGSCDRELMSTYLRQICTEAAAVLKRQRGDQYGFGDNPDSHQHISKNMTEAMMADPNATHTKSIENYFGNLDGRLKSSGARGFVKSVDDLIIKYSTDLIVPGEHKWRAKRVKEAALVLKEKESKFAQEQKELLKSVSQREADLLSEENKIIKVLAQCKKSHNGPLTSVEELNNLVNRWTLPQAALHTALNLEIRFRKLTGTTIKGDCALFRQKKLTVEEKVRNLTILISSQLGFSATAEMDDLEAAILNRQGKVQQKSSSAVIIQSQALPVQPQEIPEPVSEARESVPVVPARADTPSENWPPRVNDCVVGLFEDGFYPGEVLSVKGAEAEITFMAPAKKSESYWIWPNRKDIQTLNKNSILKVRPRLEVDCKMSTIRIVVFELLNVDIIKKFAE